MHKVIARTLFISAALLFSISGTSAYAAGLTPSQSAAILSLLQSFGASDSVVSQVQVALSGAPSASPTTPAQSSQNGSCVTLTHTLSYGSVDRLTNGDVSKLQAFLEGTVTGYFGPITKKLVQNWQLSRGVVSSPSTIGFGVVGVHTRAALACSATSTGTAVSTPTQTTATNASTGSSSSNLRPARVVPLKYYTLTPNPVPTPASVAIPSLTPDGEAAPFQVTPTPTPVPAPTPTPVTSGTPLCQLTLDKTSYTVGDPIVLSWTSTNAVSGQFAQNQSLITLPSGTQGANGSVRLSANGVGTASPALTVRGSSTLQGTATCGISFSIRAAQAPVMSGTIYPITLTTVTDSQVVSGTAQNTSSVSLAIYSTATQVFQSSALTVSNGYWSVVVPANTFGNGSYTVVLSSSGTTLASGSLTISSQ